MKNLMNIRLCLLVLCGLLAMVSSCDNNDDDDDDDTPQNLVHFDNIMLMGSNEVPPNSSTATGMFTGTYNQDTNILSYTIDYSGITPTMMHFHKAEAGQSGGVEIGIGAAPYTSPVVGETPALTAAQEADLLAGRWYVNIHSEQYPAGEIRAQLVQ